MSAVTGQSPARAIGGAVRGADLTIGGMTCASCADRIEKELNKLDRVTATVKSPPRSLRDRVSMYQGAEDGAP